MNRVSTVSVLDNISTFGLTGKDRRLGDIHKVVYSNRDPAEGSRFYTRTLLLTQSPKIFSPMIRTRYPLQSSRSQRTGTLHSGEGFLDALIATQRGLKGVVGVGLAI